MNVASTKFSLPGFACAIIVGLAACSQEAEQDQAPANRAYSGRSTASGDVRVTLLQSGNAYVAMAGLARKNSRCPPSYR